jgi:hypothetical protein
LGFVPWFSGECAIQSFSALVGELHTAKGAWIVEDEKAKLKVQAEAALKTDQIKHNELAVENEE